MKRKKFGNDHFRKQKSYVKRHEEKKKIMKATYEKMEKKEMRKKLNPSSATYKRKKKRKKISEGNKGRWRAKDWKIYKKNWEKKLEDTYSRKKRSNVKRKKNTKIRNKNKLINEEINEKWNKIIRKTGTKENWKDM